MHWDAVSGVTVDAAGAPSYLISKISEFGRGRAEGGLEAAATSIALRQCPEYNRMLYELIGVVGQSVL